MSLIEPIRIGVLMDYVPADWEGFEDGYESYPDIFDSFRLVADEYVDAGKLDRPVEFVFRLCNGLPRGRFDNVLKAYRELVSEGCLIIFGPVISENAVPLREYVEQDGVVPIIVMAASESALGEWVVRPAQRVHGRRAPDHGPGGLLRRGAHHRSALRQLAHRSGVPEEPPRRLP